MEKQRCTCSLTNCPPPRPQFSANIQIYISLSFLPNFLLCTMTQLLVKFSLFGMGREALSEKGVVVMVGGGL